MGLEKLQAVVANAPATPIRLVASGISEEVRQLADACPHVQLIERAFAPEDLTGTDIVLLAIDDPAESSRIRNLAKAAGKLVNVADKPELCDFYMGSIVRKGQLKIAISTNGKSPTVAKRLKELFSDHLPEELDELLDNMNRIREQLRGDFRSKVRQLNELTRSLSGKEAK